MTTTEWKLVITDVSGATVEYPFPDEKNMLNVVSILETAINGDQKVAKFQYEGDCYIFSSANIVNISYPNPV